MATAILTWTPNTEADLKEYRVYRNTVKIATVLKGTTTYSDVLAVDGDYTYQLTAVDTAGNESPKSVSVTKTVNTLPPSAPVGLVVDLQ
jgi:fibronectin type 3 domain-containing protein